MKYFSTSASAAELGVNSPLLFKALDKNHWISRKDSAWVLTSKGIEKGGKTKSYPGKGEYIVWPESLADEFLGLVRGEMINATYISKHFKVSSRRINLILSELGWIEKSISGWNISKQGMKLKGVQYEHPESGGTYVLWPRSILENTILKAVFIEHSTLNAITSDETIKAKDFRSKFPANFRTKDGHQVRSRAEVIIDNALYDYRLAHAYERKLPVEEELYSDFFIPSENVYIEYWGMEQDPKYQERKNQKKDIYKKYEFKLIELHDEDIENLDDHLPKKLLKFGIKVY